MTRSSVAKRKALSAGPVTWLGAASGEQSFFDARGLPEPGQSEPTLLSASNPTADDLVTCGSIVAEIRVDVWSGRDAALMRYGARDRWLRGMMITYRPGEDRLVVDMVQGEDLRRVSVRITPVIGETELRVTYSWDAPHRTGILSVEHLEAETIHQTRFRDPLPLPLGDAERLVRGDGVEAGDGQILSLGVAHGIAPVGLAPGLATGSLVKTPRGLRPVENLCEGDMVLTHENVMKPVRQVVSRLVPAMGLMRPLHLHAPFLGLTSDLVLGPQQRLVMQGGEAEYLYGQDTVMIQAQHLHHFRGASWAECGPLIRYHAVLLDSHECLSVQGLCVESLFVGPIVPDMLRTTVLSEMTPLSVPIHKLMPTPTLSQFEARNLVTELYA